MAETEKYTQNNIQNRIRSYTLTGMTCTGCQAKVEKLLAAVPGVRNITTDLAEGEATVEMDRDIPTMDLQTALSGYPKYRLAEFRSSQEKYSSPSQDSSVPKSWLATYKPILLIFCYITVISVIAGSLPNGFDGMLTMRIFMSGFFLVFSFFKMLDLEAFAESYAMYDVIAGRFKYWGYAYAFLEAALGIAFALNFQPILTNSLTLLVMSISIVGVLQSVLSGRKIRCACLGAVFNLPMSTVTIVEDALMIAMSGITISQLILTSKI